MPSIVAEIGAVIEQHMKSIGLIHDPEMSEATRQLIAEKRAAYEKQSKPAAAPEAPAASVSPSAADAHTNASGFPAGATLCAKCNTQALVLMDGCQTCLNCGYSKCG